jgi:hypothetical protein
MKTEPEHNQEILAITLIIKEYSPKSEHSMGDWAETNSDLESALAYNKVLDNYLDSLKRVQKKYE